MLYATGATLCATEALSLGVVDFVEADVESRILGWADRMRDFSPMAIRHTKRAIRTSMECDDATAFARESHLFSESWASEAHHEAVSRFLNRR
jgi:enoyl-CoA hydratase/carnithine racemase